MCDSVCILESGYHINCISIMSCIKYDINKDPALKKKHGPPLSKPHVLWGCFSSKNVLCVSSCVCCFCQWICNRRNGFQTYLEPANKSLSESLDLSELGLENKIDMGVLRFELRRVRAEQSCTMLHQILMPHGKRNLHWSCWLMCWCESSTTLF